MRIFLRLRNLIYDIRALSKRGLKKFAIFMSMQGKKLLRDIVRQPLSVITKVGSAGGVLAVVFFFLYNMFSNNVFVDDVDIQGEAGGLGRRGDELTEQALAAMPSVITNRLRRLPLEPRFGEIVDRHSDNFATERYCNSMFPLGQTNYNMYMTGLNRGEMSSRTPDKAISSDTFSIKKIAYWTRSRIGLDVARTLTPTLSRINGRYVMRLNSSPLSTYSTFSQFADLEDAPVVLANLIVDFLSPRLLATELVFTGRTNSQNFDRPLIIAEAFLRDEQQRLFILNMMATSQLDRARSVAGIHEEYRRWSRLNRELISRTDFSQYGELAPLVRWNIIDRILTSESPLRPTPDEARIFQDTVRRRFAQLRPEMRRSEAGKLLIAMAELGMGDERSFDAALTEAINDPSIPAVRRASRRRETIAFFGAMLASSNRFAEAQKLFSQLSATDLQEDREILQIHTTFSSVIRASEGNLDSYRRIVNQIDIVPPCLEYFATTKIFNILRNSNVSPTFREEANRLILPSMMRLESLGIQNFEFFNMAGIIARGSQNYDEAARFFSAALRFEGDHAWALLNWGYSALDANDLIAARNRFEQSLELAYVPNAVLGLLRTLERQGDALAYSDAARRLGSILYYQTNEQRSTLERAAMALTCNIPGTYEPYFLRSGETMKLGNRDLDHIEVRRLICL